MQVDYQGVKEEAVEVDPLTRSEAWSEFQLTDGSILMYKDILVSLFKLTSKKNQDGSPVYVLHTHKVIRLKEAPK